jgi:hypothetical protein
MKFLKCAFAPPDFDGSSIGGVTDKFSGKSTAIKYRYTNAPLYNNGTSFVPWIAGRDYYVLLAPTPGIAYFVASVTAGAAPGRSVNFQAVTYSSFSGLFDVAGDGKSCANLTTKYRYVSNHFEFVPTMNATSWAGNIQVFKLPVQCVRRENDDGGGNDRLTVTGLGSSIVNSGVESILSTGINASDMDQYTGPYNLGCYTAAYMRGGDSWNWSDIWDEQNPIPAISQAGDWGSLGNGSKSIPGFDNNFETTVIKFSGLGSTAPQGIIKTWACVEHQFVPGSVMYEMQNNRNCYDPQAMEMYRAVIQELPIGVSFLDNDSFWQRVLAIIRRVSGAASVIPGPYGMAATGVNLVANALESLTM